MRSLSMPDDLNELAKEIQAMEDRISHSDDDEMKQRTMSCRNLQELEDDEDYFLFQQQQQQQTSCPKNKSFLPGLEDLDTLDESHETVNECNITASLVSTIEEETREMQGEMEDDPEKDKDHWQQQEEAEQVIAALADLFAVSVVASSPSVAEANKPSDTIPSSPTSVTAILRKSGSSDTQDDLPQQQQQQQPCYTSSASTDTRERTISPERRSIFGRRVHQRTKDSAAPSFDDKDFSATHYSFTPLTVQSRANSMPLPRKPSLKRISSLCDNKSDNNTIKRTVSFGKLETREFSIALSDHPSCSYGPPIQLGWDYCDKQAVAVDEYEEQRSPRRSMSQMVLSYNVRRYLLLKRAGYSKAEIRQAVCEVERVKRERLVTDLFLPAMKLDETMEDFVSHIKTIFFGQQQDTF